MKNSVWVRVRVCACVSAYLRLSQSVQVGDVKGAPHSSSVHTSRPTLLQTQVVQDFAKSGILMEVGKSNTQTC